MRLSDAQLRALRLIHPRWGATRSELLDAGVQTRTIGSLQRKLVAFREGRAFVRTVRGQSYLDGVAHGERLARRAP